MATAFLDRGLLAYTFVVLAATVIAGCLVPLDGLNNDMTNFVSLLAWLGWVVFHSVVVRGGQRTGHFLVTAAGVALVMEVPALQLTDALHHSLHPQMLDVSLQSIGTWVIYLYAGFAVTLAFATPNQAWQGALAFCVVAALVTTALDLTADPVRVHVGSLSYQQGGAFMPEVEGVNGAHGIPLTNYLGWVLQAGATYVAFWFSTGKMQGEPVRGRVAALLFYVSLFLAATFPAVRLGYSQLLLIGGLPVALVAVLVTHHLVIDRRARDVSLRCGKEGARVTSLAERRMAMQRR